MPRTVYSFVHDREALDALERAWNALEEQDNESFVTLRHGWCRAAWDRVGAPNGRRLHIVVGREGDDVVFIWPLVVYRQGVLVRARPLGPEVAEYSSVLVRRDAAARERIDDAWTFVRGALRADQLLIPFVPSGSLLHEVVERSEPVRRSDRTTMSSATPPTSDSPAYLEKFDSASIDRRRRKLARRGSLAYERVNDPARRNEIIQWTVREKARWLERTGGRPMWLSADCYADFLCDASADEHVGVFALTLDGRPLAAAVARIDARRFESFLSAYDEAYKNFSVGQILRIENMQWAFARGLEYDLRVGEQEYKREWTNRRGIAVSYNVALTWRGAAAIMARGAQDRLSRVTAFPRSIRAAFGS